MLAGRPGTGDGGTTRVRCARTPGMASSAMPTPPNPSRTSSTSSTDTRIRSVANRPGSGTVTVVVSTATPTGWLRPAHTVTRVGTESAPRSKVSRTSRTTRGDGSRASSHWSVAKVPGADRHDVDRSPSSAAYGWYAGRAPVSGCACANELAAVTDAMP
jgi:hypothetical protein